MWMKFKRWLIRQLGGYWDDSPKAHIEALLAFYIPYSVRYESLRAFNKVQYDPSFKDYHGSNLGRNIKRDEATEWAKLYLKDRGAEYRDSDVNLCCELLYHLRNRV